MKWQWSLLLPTLLASPALAQQPQWAYAPPSAPASVSEPGSCAADAFADTGSDCFSGNHNHVNFINWVSNPIQNIDPRAVTAIYPIFGSQWVSSTPPIPNADFQLYGAALTIALGERFAMGLNQGGYAAAHFSRNPIDRERLFALDPLGRFRDIETSGERKGWLNLGGFFQYTLIDDVADQFIATAGMRWIAPCGAHEMFQGHGPLELGAYLTVGKEFFGRFHVLATTGFQFPAGPGEDNSKFFYSNVHFDVQTFKFLYPLVEFNSIYHTSSVSFGLPTRVGFVDFGNFEAEGNIVSLAAGVNAVLVREHVEIGAVYTTVIASQHNFDANGLLVKMTLRY
jgi:hypothetical protein